MSPSSEKPSGSSRDERRGVPAAPTVTDPRASDERLRGRTYAVPFDRVWSAALEVAGAFRGWTVVSFNDLTGRIHVEATSLVLRAVDDVYLMVGLDEDGQTRVDARARTRGGRPDLGRKTRLLGRFFRRLDRALGAGEEEILDPTAPPPWARDALLFLLLALSAGCGAAEREGAAEPATAEAPAETAFESRLFERSFVFTAPDGDSAFIVAWLTRTRTQPESVARSARGALAVGDRWETFLDTRWETPHTAQPGILLPHGSFRLLVGDGDAVEALVFEEGPRELEVSLNQVLQEWIDPRGRTIRLVEATAYLADQPRDGLVLDLSRASLTSAPQPGDWALLTSGDSLQAVIESPVREATGSPGAYRGWIRRDFQDVRVDSVTVEWAEVRAFQPARQDVPVSWTLTSAGERLSGVLEVRSAHIEAGEGAGPVLPVDALFYVSGSLTLDGTVYPVRGLFRHTGG